MKELKRKELQTINGGETGFYYLGRGLKWAWNGISDFMASAGKHEMERNYRW
jgi:bacteriocin-like protein